MRIENKIATYICTINQKNPNWTINMLVCYIAVINDIECLNYMIYQKNGSKHYALLGAIKGGHLDLVKYLVSLGADVTPEVIAKAYQDFNVNFANKTNIAFRLSRIIAYLVRVSKSVNLHFKFNFKNIKLLMNYEVHYEDVAFIMTNNLVNIANLSDDEKNELEMYKFIVYF